MKEVIMVSLIILWGIVFVNGLSIAFRNDDDRWWAHVCIQNTI